jgi:hypothetical protein
MQPTRVGGWGLRRAGKSGERQLWCTWCCLPPSDGLSLAAADAGLPLDWERACRDAALAEGESSAIADGGQKGGFLACRGRGQPIWLCSHRLCALLASTTSNPPTPPCSHHGVWSAGAGRREARVAGRHAAVGGGCSSLLMHAACPVELIVLILLLAPEPSLFPLPLSPWLQPSTATSSWWRP